MLRAVNKFQLELFGAASSFLFHSCVCQKFGSEHVGTSVWMSGCSDSENFSLLVVHTPESMTSLTP